jgi:hypothetical protein
MESAMRTAITNQLAERAHRHIDENTRQHADRLTFTSQTMTEIATGLAFKNQKRPRAQATHKPQGKNQGFQRIDITY